MPVDGRRELGADLGQAPVKLAAGPECLDHEQARERPMLAERAKHGPKNGVRPGDGIIVRAGGRLDLFRETAGRAVEKAEEDRLLAGEMEIYAALGRARGAGDLVDAGVPVSAAREDPQRGVEDALVAGMRAGLSAGGHGREKNDRRVSRFSVAHPRPPYQEGAGAAPSCPGSAKAARAASRARERGPCSPAARPQPSPRGGENS